MLLAIFLVLLNVGVQLGVRVLVKTLLMPMLIVFVLLNTRKFTTFIILIIAALALSTFGDFFMELQTHSDKFFLPGLGSFLLAHLAYITAFSYRLRTKLFVWQNMLLALALILALSGLIVYLWPDLGTMKIPVVVYALIISAACFTAYMRACQEQRKCLLFWGALLFLLSDALLSVYLFKIQFTGGRELNMTLYVAGQTLLAIGAIQVSERI